MSSGETIWKNWHSLFLPEDTMNLILLKIAHPKRQSIVRSEVSKLSSWFRRIASTLVIKCYLILEPL